MSLKSIPKAYLYLHIAVVLWGATAILGKLISFNEYILVWYRMALVAISFMFFRRTWRGLKTLERSAAIRIGLVGILVSLHWIFFYGAIKYANVSIALSILATISFMTSFIEPMVTKRKFQWYESLLGLLVIPGIFLIYHFSDATYYTGMVMALLSAFFASMFSSFNKLYVEYTNSYTFSFIQIGSGFGFLTVFLPVYVHFFPQSLHIGTAMDYVYLMVLAVGCTTIPLLLYLFALRQLNAFVTNLANNMEPVYGILLAWLIFKENQEVDLRFYIGSAIIILSVFLQPYLRRKFEC